MFGLGIQEIIVIIIVILLLIDHEKIPEFTRGVGRVYQEFKKAQDSIRDELLKEEIELNKSNMVAENKEGETDKKYEEGGVEYDRSGRAG